MMAARSLWRWTDGDAVVPLSAFTAPAVLEIHLAAAMTYVVAAVSVDGTGRVAAA
jgi:hypothetical protein